MIHAVQVNGHMCLQVVDDSVTGEPFIVGLRGGDSKINYNIVKVTDDHFRAGFRGSLVAEWKRDRSMRDEEDE